MISAVPTTGVANTARAGHPRFRPRYALSVSAPSPNNPVHAAMAAVAVRSHQRGHRAPHSAHASAITGPGSTGMMPGENPSR